MPLSASWPFRRSLPLTITALWSSTVLPYISARDAAVAEATSNTAARDRFMGGGDEEADGEPDVIEVLYIDELLLLVLL